MIASKITWRICRALCSNKAIHYERVALSLYEYQNGPDRSFLSHRRSCYARLDDRCCQQSPHSTAANARMPIASELLHDLQKQEMPCTEITRPIACEACHVWGLLGSCAAPAGFDAASAFKLVLSGGRAGGPGCPLTCCKPFLAASGSGLTFGGSKPIVAPPIN